MKMKIIFTCLIIAMTAGSCSKWIDVKPADRLAEDELFSSREGFLKALNGVYVELNDNAVYGQNMTASVIDVLAQYYYMNISTHAYFDYTMFDYTSDRTRAGFSSIWAKTYELIVNCNVIIDKCGESNPVLPDTYFGLVKGEALALRAMLHLDMLRLFGPVWSEENKGTVCIPYNTAPGPEVSPLLSAEKVMEHIVADLNEAIGLLRNADPIITEGVRHEASPTGVNDLYYRQYRMNYYAAKALLARANMWKQDKQAALLVAKEILEAVQNPDNPVFPYVTPAAATNVENPDRMFSTEVMFSLYTINKADLFSDLFAPERLPQQRLSFNPNNDNLARVNELYDDGNDFRRRAWVVLNTPDGSFLTHLKHNPNTEAPGGYMMPLIRLSELLLIAAEASPTLEEGTGYLNAVRNSRNCVSLNPTNSDDLKTLITSEFRKEVIGEGQMFFYYKRNAMQTIPNHAAITGTKAMVLNNYVVPLPESEISVREK